MTRSRLTTLLLLCLSSSANAGELSPLLEYPPIDQAVSRDELVLVNVTLVKTPTPALLEKLEAYGTIRTTRGEACTMGKLVVMQVQRGELPKLASSAAVEAVRPALPLLRVSPLNRTSQEIGAQVLWSPPPPETQLTGEGVLVADHEGGWDVFHPDFYRPDGGLFAFEDRDADNKAGPGDGIDLDGDSVFESELSLLDASILNTYTDTTPNVPANYQVDLDWLYVDVNDNGKRDYGAAFSEDTPALGEPIFIADDVNGNGRLDIGEKLLRLNTPKVLAVDVEGVVYERGISLSQYPVSAFDVSHGTGAIGVLAAGWPGLRRFTGIAPGVELLLIQRASAVEAVAVAKAWQADVLFLEWDQPIGAHDGSSDDEVAISQAADDGLVVLSAAGNLANADHVMELRNIGSSAQVAHLSTDGFGYYQFRQAWVSVAWLGGNILEVEISAPDGSKLTDVASRPYTAGNVGGRTLQVWREVTSRGTTSLTIIYGNGSTVLPNTTLSFSFRSKQSGVQVPILRGVSFDDQAGWARGVAWLDHISEAGTAITPSTADRVIAVGAYGGNNDLSMYGWGKPGEFRPYSGQGPRLDGAPVVDLSAPDDPFAPASNGSRHGAYESFGGTSGALPHTAGAAALIKEAFPNLQHNELEALLKSSAAADEFTGTLPNERIGHGKIRPAVAVRAEPSPSLRPLRLHLSTLEPPIIGRPCTLHAEVSLAQGEGDSSDALVAWDLDYDRVDDAPPSLERDFVIPALGEEPLLVVATAIDPSGATVRSLFHLVPVPACSVE
ncbi:MAG: S8 family serine peptidase, partial [Myxococcota bacterium]|nr:S8 family serine peptidase [Myxococcota bacterium]